MKVVSRVALGLFTALYIGGCGSDDDGDDGGSATPGGGSTETATGAARPGGSPSAATVLASCRERCAEEAAADCVFGDEALCVSLCDGLIPLFDARCLAIKQAAQECLLAQDDVCDSGCGEEQAASNTCDADAV